MTLILSILDENRKRVLYADKRATAGTIKALENYNKILPVGEFVVGYAGAASDRVLHELALAELKSLNKKYIRNSLATKELFFAYKKAIFEMFPQEEEPKANFCSGALLHIKETNKAFEINIDGTAIEVIEVTEEPFVVLGSGSDYARAIKSYDFAATPQDIYAAISAIDVGIGHNIQEIKMYE